MEEKTFFTPDLAVPFDHAQLSTALFTAAENYPCMELSYLGESILGKTIPMIKLGYGKKAVLYVGAHHAMEWLTSALLVKLVYELCEVYTNKVTHYGISPDWLFELRTLYVVPMLNPDGVEYQIHGVQKDNPLYDRLLAMNGGKEDFTTWQANARGVDLNHNYDAGFEEYKQLEQEQGIFGGAPTRYSGEAPESEHETALLCNFIRYHHPLGGVITLHTQGEEIYYKSKGMSTKKSAPIARWLAKTSGYRLSEAEGLASYGGLTDWCIQKMGIPSFTVECGSGRNPLPFTDFSSVYFHLRQALFTFPTLL